MLLLSSFKGTLDLLVCALPAAVNRLRVEAEEDSDAVASPPRDLSRGEAGLKPERDARVAQEVRHVSQR
ncbi:MULTISPECIES: hypothetical protein [unclassified Streptomyces]|uniref:hypothetical protein n=1 Tax=unclassified Streptomyces TaxID=2593676 RepID=UPI0022506306|nr:MULTISPECIES: hypothetical protein [unclassified Streptomyces]MCX5055844.1 hypothetical protein [Streptomyces sp. NBC_00452]MCX5286938.1 hypothetical protein [Streptomyces sp. NBC_00183]